MELGLVDLANAIFRDFETDGVPASGTHKPRKPKIREWGTWLESLITAFTSNGGLLYFSKASLDADLAHGPNTMAWVIGDTTVANNGIYFKSGASGAGSWTRWADLPYSFIRLNDVGAGTANAIQVTSSLPTSSSVLRVANVFEANTGNVTISENGGAAKSLRTNSGNQIVAGGLTAGMMITYVDDGTNFRLLSDQASAAIVAAAEAAQAGAENARDAALAAVPNAFPSTFTILKALPNTVSAAFLTKDAQRGQFLRRSGDFSSYVSSGRWDDIIVKTDDTAATVAAMVRADFDVSASNRKLHLSWFGYQPDDSTDNTAAVNKAIAIANENGNTDIMVPVGVGRVGACNAIIKPNVRFRSEGAAGQSVFRGTDATAMITLGDAANPIISGFGFDGIGFYGMGTNTFSAIRVANAQEIVLNNPVIGDGLATLVSAGASGGVYAGMVAVSNMTGRVPNIAAPLIRLVNGSGLFVNGSTFYNQASPGQAKDGRDFIQVLGSWNTCSVKDTFAFLFDHGLFALVTSGQQFGDVMLTNNYLDEMNEGILLFADTGASIANVDIRGNETTGKRKSGIRIAGSGTFLRINIDQNVVRETKENGIAIASPVAALSLVGNCVTQTNEACSFVGSISGTTLTVTSRLGAPGGTLAVGDVISGPGVTPGTTITSVPANEASFPGVYGVSPSQTVAAAALATDSGHFASLYMAAGSDGVIIANNSFGPQSASLGGGYGAYGGKIDGGVRFHVSNNSAEGATAPWNVTGLTESSSTDFGFTYTPTLTDSAGGSFTATVTGAYKRIGNRIQVTVTGNISATTATGFLRFTLPKTAAASPAIEYSGCGNSVGILSLVRVLNSGTYGEIRTFNGGATASSVGAFAATVEYAV